MGVVGAGIEVSLLGPVVARVDGPVIGVTGAPQRTLLARLALVPQRVVPDAALLEVLWPGEPPANATGNLQSYVSRLRRVLGVDAVVRGPMGYRLDVDPEAVDVVRFEALCRRAHELARTDPRAAAIHFGDALALWRGEAFADVVDPLAFEPERVRFDAMHQQAKVGWLAARVSTGGAADAIPDLEQAVTAAPLDEALHLVLIRALHLVGRTADGLRTGADLRRRVIDETGLGPSSGLAQLERQLLEDDPSLQPRSAERSAPGRHLVAGAATAAAAPAVAPRPPADRFVGRADELAQLEVALGTRRVVTIVGPGGAGKTRLALELVERGGAGSAIVIELGAVATSSDVVACVATGLGLQAAPGGLLDAVRDRLAGCSLTLVLDNCEHVVDGVVTLLGSVLATSPDVRVLATSRIRLGVAGEQVVRLGRLDPRHQAELFRDRAALERPGFEPDDEDQRLIEAICGQLDGLPLALELAARREAVFGLALLAERLADGLGVIEPGDDEGGSGVVSAVGWSYRLLRPAARALFDRLAVCRGGFTLDALADLAPSDTANPAGALAELVDASLVEVDLTGGEPRYRLLEIMRRVALGHLDESSLAEARRAHRGWMLRLAGACFQLQSERSPRSTTIVRTEVANLVAALAIHEVDDLPEVAHLGVLIASLTADEPQLELSDALLRLEAHADGDDEASALSALGAGSAAMFRGDTDRGHVLLDRAVRAIPAGHPLRWVALSYRMTNALFTGDRQLVTDDARAVLDDPSTPAWCRATAVGCAALISAYLGEDAEAQGWIERYASTLEDVRAVDAFVPFVRGELSVADSEEALRWYEEALATSEATGQVYNRHIAAVGRAAVLVRLDRRTDAAAACASAIADAVRVGMWPQAWTALRLSAELLVALGEHEAAALVLDAAAHDDLASEVLDVDRSRQEDLWRVIAERLPPEQVAAARRTARRDERGAIASRTVEVLLRHAGTRRYS